MGCTRHLIAGCNKLADVFCVTVMDVQKPACACDPKYVAKCVCEPATITYRCACAPSLDALASEPLSSPLPADLAFCGAL